MCREERSALFGPQLGHRLHGKATVAFGQQAERRLTVLVGELAENLSEIGGVLLLQQIQKVCGRTDTQQSFDRIENEVNPALRRHAMGPSVIGKQLNVARSAA